MQLRYQLTGMELKIWLEYPIQFAAEEMEMWTIFRNQLSENESIRYLETRELMIRLEGHGLEECVQIREQTLDEGLLKLSECEELGDHSDEEKHLE